MYAAVHTGLAALGATQDTPGLRGGLVLCSLVIPISCVQANL